MVHDIFDQLIRGICDTTLKNSSLLVIFMQNVTPSWQQKLSDYILSTI